MSKNELFTGVLGYSLSLETDNLAAIVTGDMKTNRVGVRIWSDETAELSTLEFVQFTNSVIGLLNIACDAIENNRIRFDPFGDTPTPPKEKGPA
jgi:hypothetical protein